MDVFGMVVSSIAESRTPDASTGLRKSVAIESATAQLTAHFTIPDGLYFVSGNMKLQKNVKRKNSEG
jgi:hypothetical protein